MATKGKELSELGSILSVSANTANIDGSLIVSNSVTIGNSTVNATFTATSINANTVGGNTASDLRSYSDTVAATAYSNAATYAGTAAGTAYSNAATYADNKAANAYSNAIAYSANATNISSGTLTANVLPTSGVTAATYGNSSQIPVITVDATGRITSATTNAVAGVTSFTYTEANNTFAISTGDGSTFAANIGTANATHTGVLKVLDSVANTNTTIAAAVSSVKTAYDAAIAANTNAASAYSNAISYADTVAGTAYTNATSYAATIAGTAYSNGVTYTDNKAANAYSNATTFASNASNISSGTLAEPRLPFRMDQNVRTNDSVSFGSVSITGNLTVTGTTVTINTTNLTVDDNMIYLNEGAGGANANPDLGFAGAYNDGTYRHAGFFRDASDGVWKVFDQYLPEPDASPFIDTANASFRIANFQANVVTAASLSGNGASVTSVDAATVGGNTAGTLRSYSDSVAATAYTNAVSSASSSAATAYSNAVSYFTTNYTASDVLTKIKTVDGTGSGLDADTVDGYDASSFALKTDPEFTNDITTSSGQGRFGGWYAGTGYTGAAFEVGISAGEAYALAYNRGTSSYLNMNFGATDFQFAGESGGYAHINTSFRAPIFYDTANTSYYLDPASTSNLNVIQALDGVFGNQGVLASGYPLTVYDSQRYMLGMRNSGADANYVWLAHDTWNGTSALVLHFDSIGDRFTFNEGGIGSAAGDFRAPIFYDSANTSFYVDPASRSRLSTVDLGNSGYYMTQGDWGWRHVTPDGWIQFGPANSSYAHIYTDRGNFYFNVSTLYANGSTMWHAGNDGSGSGLDADLLDGSGWTSGQTVSFGSATFTVSGYPIAAFNNTNSANYGLVEFTQSGTHKAWIGMGGSGMSFGTGAAYDTDGFSINADGAGAFTISNRGASKWIRLATGTESTSNFYTLNVRNGDVIVNQDAISYSSMDNTPVVGSTTTNRLHVNGSIQLTNNNDAIVFGRGTATFLKDEELGFGWGGGWYMEDSTWVRVRNNKNIYGGSGIIRTDGDMRAPVFYDQSNTSFYVDAASTSRLTKIHRTNPIYSEYASYTNTTNNLVRTWDGVLVAGSDSAGAENYTVIETNVPQDQYMMGGFTIDWFENYQNSNTKTRIQITGGYWNPESNGGFIGFEYTSSNPNLSPTIQVGRNASNGKTVFILSHFNSSYNIIVARDLWLGYSTGAADYGDGWAISQVSSLAAYTNLDTVVARTINTVGSTQSHYAASFVDTASTAYYLTPSSSSRINTINYDNLYWAGDANYGFIGRNVYADTINSGAVGDQLELCYYRGTYTTTSGSMRAPLFYDTNDTSYYLDPHSTSVLNAVNYWGVQFWNGDGVYARGTNTYGYRFNNYADTINAFLINNSGDTTSYASSRAPIFYDSNNTSYYTDPASSSNMNVVTANGGMYGLWWEPIGVGGDSGNAGHSYRIFQEGGAWSNPYPDLRIAFHTGIKFGGNSSYEGMRFYTDYDMSSLVLQVNGSSNYIYKYTWLWTNTTGMYSDTNGWHIEPNTLSSYGGTAIRGVRNSWRGIHFYDGGNTPHLMFDGSANGGFYYETGGRWALYYSYAANCWGIRSSTTSSSYAIYASGSIYSTDNIVAASDARLKENVITVESALDKVNALRGVYYNRIDDEEKKRKIGVIAQEVEPVIPEVVTHDKENDRFGVDYGNLAGLFIEAFKEQTKIINSLKEKIEELEAKLEKK